tara:strand:- start:46 stop:354 length:309 start_codon:yes stop_codon:yes gene_type:complete
MANIIKAILSINPSAEVVVRGTDIDTCTIEWFNNTPEISKADIQTKLDELQVEYDAQEYARKREAEYPSIQDLIVALYDTEDKAAIEAKRAEIKLKYPKPVA